MPRSTPTARWRPSGENARAFNGYVDPVRRSTGLFAESRDELACAALPELDRAVDLGGSQESPVRREANAVDRGIVLSERGQFGTLGLLPKVTPLEAAKVVRFAWRWNLPGQQFARAIEVVLGEGFARQVHLGGVERATRLLLAFGGLPRLSFGALLLGLGIFLCRLRCQPLLLLAFARAERNHLP